MFGSITAAYSYNASVVFEIISGITVGSPGFDIDNGYIGYRRDLKMSVSILIITLYSRQFR